MCEEYLMMMQCDNWKDKQTACLKGPFSFTHLSCWWSGQSEKPKSSGFEVLADIPGINICILCSWIIRNNLHKQSL